MPGFQNASTVHAAGLLEGADARADGCILMATSELSE